MIPTRYYPSDFLRPEDAISRYQTEKIDKDLDRYRLWDHRDFKDFQRRKGEVVHSSRFISRLRQIEPRLIVQQQVNFPDDWGLYLQKGNRLVFIAPISKGWMTEFSYTEVDAHDLPSDPHWGWRTTLLRLMSKGIIAWDTVEREFGNPHNANTERWEMLTSPFRSRQSSRLSHQNLFSHFE